MNQKIIYEINSEDLETFVGKKEIELFLSRFSGVFINAEELAKIHGVSSVTVRNYVKDGLLIPEYREKERDQYRFRLSYALSVDFKELKKQLIQRKQTA